MYFINQAIFLALLEHLLNNEKLLLVLKKKQLSFVWDTDRKA